MGKGRKAVIELEDLPEGWVIIEKTRSTGKQINKFPHDTKTNKTFRSMVQVRNHILGLDGKGIPCPKPLDMIQGSSSSGSGPTAQTFSTTRGDESCNVKDGMPPQSGSLASKATIYQGSGLGTESENKRKRDEQDNVTPIKKTVAAGDEEENVV